MLNKVMLQGRFIQDVELINKEYQNEYCNFTIAVVNRRDVATYIDLKAYGNNAVYISEYGKKGAIITLQAHLKNFVKEVENKKIFLLDVKVDKIFSIINMNNVTE